MLTIDQTRNVQFEIDKIHAKKELSWSNVSAVQKRWHRKIREKTSPRPLGLEKSAYNYKNKRFFIMKEGTRMKAK